MERDASTPAPRLAELRCVREQVEQHLDDAVDIGPHRRHLLRHIDLDLDAALFEHLAHAGHGFADQRAHVDFGLAPLRLAGLDLREVEHLVDQPRQTFALLRDDAEKAFALLGVDIRMLEQDLRKGADRGERRAQLVRHGGDEVVLQAVELLQALVRRAQLSRGRLELARLLLQPVAVDNDLRGLVEDLAQLLDRQRFFLRHRGDHDARRGGADGAGELHLDVVHQLRVGLERVVRPALASRGGIAAKRLLGGRNAEEARKQVVELGRRGRAAPEARAAALAALAKDVDEQARLPMLVHARRAGERHADIGTDVGEHAPDHRVRDLIEAGEAEERERLQERDAARAVLEQADRQPARTRERGQEQRIEPHDEARDQPGERAFARAALPEDAAQHRRGELRHRRKRDQADRDERIGLAGELEVQIAEQQDEHDRAAADAEQEPRQVRLLVQAQRAHAKEHRHHQVIAHHGGERDGFDDHHAGRRRQAADEHQQGEQLALLGHRQRKHEGVGVDAAIRKAQQAAKGDWQHEDIDREHVERKQPDRLV